MAIVDEVYDVGQWSSGARPPWPLDFLTSCFVRGFFWRSWPAERAAQRVFVVCLHGPAERMNDVTDPCCTISPVDVSWRAAKTKKQVFIVLPCG